jgi:hypothetical protein
MKTVHGFESYRQFIGVTNIIDSASQASVMRGLREPADSSATFGNIYLTLYAVGSIVVLVGRYLDD